MEKVHDITRRHELLGEKVPNSEKIFSIYEAHTDIIVKGRREAEFGHKVNLTAAGAISYWMLKRMFPLKDTDIPFITD